MNNLPRKKLFDDNGVLINESDIIKISKSSTGHGAICLIAKYDKENQRWLFYSGTVAYTWEDLKVSQVKSIVVSNNETKKE